MRIVILSTVFAAAAVLALGCDLAPTSTPQAISGVVSQDTFPAPVTTVRVVSGTAVVNEAQVDANNAFTLIVPPGKGYKIEFLAGAAGAGLVFPRSAGGVEVKFDVKASQSPFDMGAVRYVGDPSSWSFQFATDLDEDGDVECEQEGENEGENEGCVDDSAEDDACEDEEDGEDDGDTDDIECEDGVDPNTGLPCADDDDGEVEDGDDEGDTDDVECEDGVDPNTGLPCADDDDGEVEDEMPSEAAVAERNLSSSVGCGDEDDDNVECEQEGENEGDNSGC